MKYQPLRTSADLAVSSVEAALAQAHISGDWTLHVPKSLQSIAKQVLSYMSGGSLVLEDTLRSGRTRAWYVQGAQGACGSFVP